MLKLLNHNQFSFNNYHGYNYNQFENKENKTQKDINQSIVEPNVKDCKLFKSTKGQFKLSLDGFTYEKSSNVEQKKYWTCEERKKGPYHYRTDWTIKSQVHKLK
jgi:hypothetical protein